MLPPISEPECAAASPSCKTTRITMSAATLNMRYVRQDRHAVASSVAWMLVAFCHLCKILQLEQYGTHVTQAAASHTYKDTLY